MKTPDDLTAKYDTLAKKYANLFCDELDSKPFDRNLLQRFVDTLPDGLVCDLGCGPGHVTAHLSALGVNVIGVDISSGMIGEAKCRYPTSNFMVGNMCRLDMEPHSLAGALAFYSIIHFPRDVVNDVFTEMHRVIQPGGYLLISFHRGKGTVHEDEVFGMPVSFDATLFEPDEISQALTESGFSVAEVTTRRPYEFIRHSVDMCWRKRIRLQVHNMEYSISSNKSRIDVKAVHDYLCHRSYWAKGRSLESVKKSIDNSMCFGLYAPDNRMLGFARVVTDKVVFAYLMDLFIFEKFQGKGLGTDLAKHIIEHPDLQVELWFLATQTAHGLYEKFGFSGLDTPGNCMLKRDEKMRSKEK